MAEEIAYLFAGESKETYYISHVTDSEGVVICASRKLIRHFYYRRTTLRSDGHLLKSHDTEDTEATKDIISIPDEGEI